MTPAMAGADGGRDAGWSQTGSATVLVLALCAVVVLAGCLAGALGAVAVARHRAAATADLAALAGAAAGIRGAQPCDAVRQITDRSGAELAGCRAVGADVTVAVTVRPAGLLGRIGAATVRAHAGPAGRRSRP